MRLTWCQASPPLSVVVMCCWHSFEGRREERKEKGKEGERKEKRKGRRERRKEEGKEQGRTKGSPPPRGLGGGGLRSLVQEHAKQMVVLCRSLLHRTQGGWDFDKCLQLRKKKTCCFSIAVGITCGQRVWAPHGTRVAGWWEKWTNVSSKVCQATLYILYEVWISMKFLWESWLGTDIKFHFISTGSLRKSRFDAKQGSSWYCLVAFISWTDLSGSQHRQTQRAEGCCGLAVHMQDRACMLDVACKQPSSAK